MQGKTIAVIGGAGFIGSNLVDEIVKENPKRLAIIDNFSLGKKKNLKEAEKNFPNLDIYNCDASRLDTLLVALSNHRPDIVVNCAVIPLPSSLTHPYATFETNVKIVQNLCELQRLKYFDALIHFSSSEVYGTAEYLPMNENHPLNGTTPYAASKAAGDQLIYSYYKTFGLDDYSIIRPFNNYGPRQNSGESAGIVPLCLRAISQNKEIIISGDGKQTRDYIHVTDVAKAAIKIYKNPETRGKVINIGSGKQIEIRELVLKICNAFNYDKITYGPERAGDVRCHQADISLAEKLINFSPEIRGIEKAIKSFGGDYLEN